jgi:hypothetical protein
MMILDTSESTTSFEAGEGFEISREELGLKLIQSLDWIKINPVLGLDQN